MIVDSSNYLRVKFIKQIKIISYREKHASEMNQIE